MAGAVQPLLLCLSLVLGPAPEDCPDCLPGTRRAELCEPHGEQEKAGLKACAAGLKQDLPAERLAALRELAALTEAHANAPSPLVVKTLARGLGDEDEEVVLGTIELLGRQHPEAVLVAYVDHLRDLAKRYEDLTEKADKVAYRRELRRLKGTRDSSREIREEERDAAELAELQAGLSALDRATDGISAQLGRFRDDRAVAALDTLLELNARGATASALAALGNLEAAEALQRHLERSADLYRIVSELRETVSEIGDTLGDGELPEVDLDDMYDQARKPVAAAHEGLAQIARAAGLEQGIPELTTAADEAWKEWLAEHRKALPPDFGRMQLPWDE